MEAGVAKQIDKKLDEQVGKKKLISFDHQSNKFVFALHSFLIDLGLI